MPESARTNALLRFAFVFGVAGVDENTSDHDAALAIHARYRVAQRQLGGRRDLVIRFRLLIRAHMECHGLPCPMTAATELAEELDPPSGPNLVSVNAALCAAIELSVEAANASGTGPHTLH